MPGRFGTAPDEDGAYGNTTSSAKVGVFGNNEATAAPQGGGAGGAGVFGLTVSAGAAGVFGANNGTKGVGVQGNGPDAGVSGFSDDGVGVRAHSSRSTAVEAFTHNADQNAVYGMNTHTATVSPNLGRPAGAGVWGHTKAEGGAGVVGSVEPGLTQAAGITGIGPVAGRFFGDVEVTGDIKLLGADVAERFEIAAAGTASPGTLMIIGDDGRLEVSASPYDARAIGVVAGAGTCRPGLILNTQGDELGTCPIALAGKVFCRVVDENGPIKPGDLLTSSSRPGYAMKASDATRLRGAIVGKALAKHPAGDGLIPMLVAIH